MLNTKKLHRLEGRWNGAGIQTGNQTWIVELNYIYEKDVFIISYPSLGCKGTWQLVKHEKCKIEFLEKISEGSCDNNVKVILTKADKDFISIAYFIPSFSDDIIAFTVLTRK